jgi:hypothetical protein
MKKGHYLHALLKAIQALIESCKTCLDWVGYFHWLCHSVAGIEREPVWNHVKEERGGG